MTTGPFDEGSPTVLPSRLFQFMLDLELRRGVRSQTFLTLITIDTVREWEHMTFMADEGTMVEMAGIVGTAVRGTDLIGHSDEGSLGVVLFHSGFEHSMRVIDRLVNRIENYEFATALRISIGAACYPEHGSDLASLKGEAAARSVVTLRRRAGSPPGADLETFDQN